MSDPADFYYMRRLKESRRAQELAASIQADLAFDDNLDDDELELALSHLDSAAPYGEHGFGLAAVFGDLMTRQPEMVVTDDLKSMQAYLKGQGYAPPETPVDGLWTAQWEQALRRADRDAFTEHRSGAHTFSTTVSNAMNFLGNVTPPNVFQALVGAAKGIIEQTPETAERLGLAGGAAAGAAIGTAVAPGVGTVVGAGVGAVAGLFADLLGDDETEGADRSGWADLWDALTPWEEYRGEGGMQRFYEDIGFVTTAASLVSGARIAAAGVKAGATAMQSAQAAGINAGRLTNINRAALGAIDETSDLALKQKLMGLTLEPGLAVKAMTARKAPIYGGLAGGAVGGLATGTEEGVVMGALAGAGLGGLGKKFAPSVRGWVQRNALMAQTSRPLIRSINGGFTGLSAGSIGARLGAGVGQGRDVYDNDGNLLIDKESSTIAESIEDAPAPFDGLAGDALGLLIFPSQLLPLRGLKISEGINKMLGEDALWGIMEGTYKGGSRSKHLEGIKSALGKLNPDDADEAFDPLLFARRKMRLDISAGIDAKIEKALMESGHAVGEGFESKLELNIILRKQFHDEVAKMREAGDGFDTMNPDELRREFPLITDLMETVYSPDGQLLQAAYAHELTARGGGGVEALARHEQTERIVDHWNNLIRGGHMVTGKPGEDAAVIVHGIRPKFTNPARKSALEEVNRIEAEIKGLEDSLPDSPDVMGQVAQINERKKEVARLTKSIQTMGEFLEPAHDINLVVGNTLDPQTGAGTVTQQWVRSLYEEIDTSIDSLAQARKNLRELPEGSDDVARSIQQEYTETLRHIWNEDDPSTTLLGRAFNANAITIDQYTMGVRAVKNGRTAELKDIVAHLEGNRRYWPRQVDISPEMAAALPEGKTVVAVAFDPITVEDIPGMWASKNAEQFALDPGMWDSVRYAIHSVGLSPVVHKDQNIYKLKTANQANEVQMAVGDRLPIDGRRIINRLHTKLTEHNNKDVIPLGPAEARGIETGTGEVKTKVGRPLLNVNEIKPDKIREWLDLDSMVPADMDPDEVAVSIFDAIKRGSALGATPVMSDPIHSARMLAHALRVEGMPGFVEFMRTFHIDDPRGMGVVAGGLAGAVSGDDPQERLRNAAGGALLGLGFDKGLKQLPKGSYGYLPDKLHRASMAIRYSFSIAFDAGRHMENAYVATMREGLPFALRKDSYLKNAGAFDSIARPGTKVMGDDAMREAIHLHEIVSGRRDVEALDEMMRWMFQKGILGYSPRIQEAANLFLIAQKERLTLSQIKSRSDELLERIRLMEGYGLGRSNFEKTVNFFFFPFSFQKKLMTTSHDFLFQAPARALLIHEGFRRFQESQANERFEEFTRKWLPVLGQLSKLNNLAYGLGPGRFFLQGFDDNKSDVGRAAQALTSLFVPSGANTPIAQLAGGLGDAAYNQGAESLNDMGIHFFMPVVVTDDTPIEEAFRVIKNFAPALKDVAGLAEDSFNQGLALTNGGDPYWQTQNYLDQKRAVEAQYEPLAQALGYSSVQGLMSSDAGAALAGEYEVQMRELASEFPLGLREVSEFENKRSLNDQALYELAKRPRKSPAESAILRVQDMVGSAKQLAEVLGVSQAEAFQMVQTNVREEAMRHMDDKQFLDLWKRFFAPTFGPLVRVA